ncbi:hypothetical protein EVAR_51697_1 [Eumeta japonica]|uniref:Uncharacterized protein n=1 Tax=Eumeta variegata TaxID=151549 RepID=A0A4C1XFV0_EUMVA|nr:hypothetical protein EVAR_51697_1 [Eumeta japonica]
MVSRLCGKVCAPSAQEALAAEVGLDFVYREVVNFNAVVGGADGFTVVYPQTGAVCGYLKLAPLRKNGWRQFRPRRCGGLGTRPRSGFGGHRLRGSGDWISG